MVSNKLKVYSIHPTAMKCSVDGKQLFNVGPYEFLKLINNAEIICTDSFHATAFSVIFHKKLAHIINNGKESRVKSLLERINAYSGLCLKNGITGIVDLSRVDENKLNHLISESKCFLLDALSKRNV